MTTREAAKPHPHDRSAIPTEADVVHLDPLSGAFGNDREGRLLFWTAVAFSAFQLATAIGALNLPSQILRAVHVGFLLLLAYPLIGRAEESARWVRVAYWGLALAGFAVGLYQWIFYADLILRAGQPDMVDMVVGTIFLALIFHASYLAMGWALPAIAGFFLFYALLGQYLPAPLNHRGFAYEQVIDQMSFGTEGIYGVPVYVSATYIFLFILFGAFLERAGMIRLFNDVALGLFGRARGGPAKVAVFSSALMGMISGSGVANVVTVGQFTIPLMKRFGYRPTFAGGVEATASMGGQIMPPVMGAVAFIMAETLGIPYSAVVQAAVIPALLYFGSAFWMVHLEAGREGLHGLPPSQLPSALTALRDNWYLVLPLAVLVYLLFTGYTPLFSGSMGLALTVMLILGGSIALGLPSSVIRTIFWIGLGLVASAFFRYGINVILIAIAALIAVSAVTAGGRHTLALCRDSLAEGAKTALPVGLACAISGIMIGAMTLTGAATTFGQFVLSVGETSLFLSLVLTMVVCIILGTGIPTIPSYIITAALAGPALRDLGVPLLISHMFVFYYGILADLTPPVALAAFAAAPIARASGQMIGWQACKIALAGFAVPFMAVYSPALMLQPGDPMADILGFPGAVAYILFKTLIAVGLWGVAAVGYWKRHASWWERALALAASGFLIGANPLTDAIGFVLTAIFAAQHVWRVRQGEAAG